MFVCVTACFLNGRRGAEHDRLEEMDVLLPKRLLVLRQNETLLRRQAHRLAGTRHRRERECTEHLQLRVERPRLLDDAESRLHTLDAVGGELNWKQQVLGGDEAEFRDVVELVWDVHEDPVVVGRQKIKCLTKLARLLREKAEEPLLVRGARNDVESL